MANPPPQSSWNNMLMSYEDYQTLWEYSAEHEVHNRPSSSGDRVLESQTRSSGFELRLRQTFSHDEYHTLWEYSAEQYSPNRPSSSGDRALESQSRSSGFEPRLRQSFSRPQEGNAKGIVAVGAEAPRVVPVGPVTGRLGGRGQREERAREHQESTRTRSSGPEMKTGDSDSLGIRAQAQQAGRCGFEPHSEQCFSLRGGQREHPPPPGGGRKRRGIGV